MAVSGERVKLYTWKTREGGGSDEGGLELFFFFLFANFSSPLYCLNAWNRLPTNVNYVRRFMVGNYYKDIARISLSTHLKVIQFHWKLKGLKTKSAS